MSGLGMARWLSLFARDKVVRLLEIRVWRVNGLVLVVELCVFEIEFGSGTWEGRVWFVDMMSFERRR